MDYTYDNTDFYEKIVIYFILFGIQPTENFTITKSLMLYIHFKKQKPYRLGPAVQILYLPTNHSHYVHIYSFGKYAEKGYCFTLAFTIIER